MKNKFKTVIAYNNYFGEKKSIQQCFFEFYSIWMLVPAVFSGIILIYQTFFQVETRWVFIYAAGIAFWTTILIERWKRKEHFIAYKWGKVIEKNQDAQTVMNPGFLGFYKFSWSSN